MHFGADLEKFFAVQQRRRETFQAERDKRPETWTFDWRDRPREAIRQILGYLIGEPQPARSLAGVGCYARAIHYDIELKIHLPPSAALAPVAGERIKGRAV
jgi:hypothetical protein